jgi:hypothetical protein
MSEQNDDITCLCTSETCFFLPFYQASSTGSSKEQSQWESYMNAKSLTPEQVKALAGYADKRISRCAELMQFLMKMNAQWDVIPRTEGIYMETDSLKYEDILPILNSAGFTGEDFVIYSEYARKWGIS